MSKKTKTNTEDKAKKTKQPAIKRKKTSNLFDEKRKIRSICVETIHRPHKFWKNFCFPANVHYSRSGIEHY